MLLDAHRRAQRLGGSTELYAETLGDDPLLQAHHPEGEWPQADVALIGAGLVAAFRPYPRDLAKLLGPPGSDDLHLEAAAQHLLEEDDRLIMERLEQEQKVGIEWHPDGWVAVHGKRLPREGLASSLRHRWVGRIAPDQLLGLADIERAQERAAPASWRWVLIHDPAGPPRSPEALVCPMTQRRLALAGHEAARLLDRSQSANYALWGWLEPVVEQGTSVLMHSDRDALLKTFAEAWFSAP